MFCFIYDRILFVIQGSSFERTGIVLTGMHSCAESFLKHNHEECLPSYGAGLDYRICFMSRTQHIKG